MTKLGHQGPFQGLKERKNSRAVSQNKMAKPREEQDKVLSQTKGGLEQLLPTIDHKEAQFQVSKHQSRMINPEENKRLKMSDQGFEESCTNLSLTRSRAELKASKSTPVSGTKLNETINRGN